MPCETCGHTMERFTAFKFWCPRCGTVLDVQSEYPKSEAPKLVDRCRQFEGMFAAGEASGEDAWRRYGIEESIRVKEGMTT